MTEKPTNVHVRLPQTVKRPLERAASRLTISQAAFIRQAVVEKLTAGGEYCENGALGMLALRNSPDASHS